MSALMTTLEIISLAYITELDPAMIKDSFILTAQVQYIKPALTAPLYDDVLLDPAGALYGTLVDDYIKPCLAYYVKGNMLNQQLLETSQYTTGSDPALAQSLMDVSTAVMISPEHRRDIVKEVFAMAKYKLDLLIDYLVVQEFPLYTLPVSRRISGFIITPTI
jgi:hypothetical protein